MPDPSSWIYDTRHWPPTGGEIQRLNEEEARSVESHIMYALNERGDHGWELVSAVPQPDGELLLLFKQPTNQEPLAPYRSGFRQDDPWPEES